MENYRSFATIKHKDFEIGIHIVKMQCGREGSVCVYLVYVLRVYICVYFIDCISWFYPFVCVNLKKKEKKNLKKKIGLLLGT